MGQLQQYLELSGAFVNAQLFQEQQLQYDFIAGKFRRQHGKLITSMPAFMTAEYIVRTSTRSFHSLSRKTICEGKFIF